jgi:uncharacterized protein with HEPN domain
MRQKLVHDYYKVDLDILWVTLIRNLPQLIRQIKPILAGRRGKR